MLERCAFCGQAGRYRCPACERPYCADHGDQLCQECDAPRSALPSPFLFRTAVISLALALLTGAWYFFMADGLAAVSPPPPFVESGLPAGGSQQIALATLGPTLSAEAATTPSSAPAAPTIAAAPPTLAPTFTPTPAPTPTPTPLPILTYTVEAGDSLSTIGKRFGVGVQDLIQANALRDPDAIAIGQRLVIPR